MDLRRILALVCIILLVFSGLLAQDTGQICIMSFDDHNGNGQQEDNEPPFTYGIGVSLLSALGVTLETSLLENSPTASSGLLCFEGLSAGDYMVLLTSAQVVATTASSFNAVVVPGAAPARFDFGVAAIQVESESTISETGSLSDEQARALQGIAVGVFAAAISAGCLFLIGLLIYLRVFRRRLKQLRAGRMVQQPWHTPSAEQARTNPNPQPAIPGIESAQPGQYAGPPNPRDPSRGSPLLFDEDDTSPMA